jgi:hypothetical protein
MTHHSVQKPNRRLLTRSHILLNVLFSNELLTKQSLIYLSLYTTSPVLLLHCTRSFNDVGNDTSGSPPLHPSTDDKDAAINHRPRTFLAWRQHTNRKTFRHQANGSDRDAAISDPKPLFSRDGVAR